MDNKQTPETNDEAIEAVIAESVGQAEPSPKRGTGLLTRVLVLLFVVVALVFGTLAAGGHLQPLLQKLTASFDAVPPSQAPIDPEQVVAQPAPAATQDEAISHEAGSFVLPVTAPATPVVDTPAEPVEPAPAVEEEPAMAPVISQPVVGKAEIDHLMTTIDTLSGELALMRKAQNELKTNRDQQQQMDLQVRTGWLVDPAISLQQTQQAWEEIALLPGLTAGQRDEANRMHALATRTAREVKQWRETLVKWADMMVVPVHPEVLPQPEHPWLAWIVGQFHLHKAPSAEADRLSGLRTRLLDAARHLSLEAWPDKATWQALHAELLLQVRAFSAANAEPMPELGLPENLDALQRDVALLHSTAQSWKARGQEGI
ncbi:MAG: hypothetical protein COW18_01950 [Zetaproteobacteria bacterium CG12_big_fil_rev_8_21_14_0_65_54_13]|nr:MAG: hypothetical protein AUJ57_11545 [Zetaproteobacteria bacterium CG1_02_53_45]PIP03005.1 MAG: hypothetical protein COX55_02200 [Zetaproteobacteria bacterium CG23_combo_of_CG06-09_8_20_14_all_54_7]PIW51263.1 MAG: hypothetical protein COW18_01950 [Zetaproteobacteria bacterium CG12_big_fil_rev_8_21_14_0_65_54_13]PIX53396.1 MAG: hypothetical protein COZ50_13530 [Zetaproteobacteria bacterium CG_4_10_14_3_um_filter_54_28]PJA29332.1 MAG: hypothetical protein CO188_06880 [Zetaproteobacteria bacte